MKPGTKTRESTSLKRTVPPGFGCIDAARPIPPDAAVDSLHFQNHGGLAIIHRDSIGFRKKCLDVNVTTFELLCGVATMRDRHLVLVGVYRRPGSQTLTSAFYDELAAVFERLSTTAVPSSSVATLTYTWTW